MDGWIRLHRKIMSSPVSHDPFLLKLWILCITKASYREREILIGRQMIHIQRGEFITGRESLAKEYNEYTKPSLHVKPLTLWRWLYTLESMGNLNIKTNNKFSVVSVVNFDFYNPDQYEDEQQNEQLVNSKRTTNEQLVNTNKKVISKEGDKEKTNTCKDILSYMNEICETSYKYSSKATQTLIGARIREGFTLENFKTVIDNMANEWKNDERMRMYLRPQTLFGTKFESYLNRVHRLPEQPAKTKQQDTPTASGKKDERYSAFYELFPDA